MIEYCPAVCVCRWGRVWLVQEEKEVMGTTSHTGLHKDLDPELYNDARIQIVSSNALY